MIHLRHDVRPLFDSLQTVGDFLALGGDIAKEKDNRCTVRIERDGRAFYLKAHHPVGPREVMKSWLRFRSADVGAMAEWRAIARLHEINVPTMAAAGYGIEGHCLPTQRSFLLTDELTDIVSLEDIAEGRCDIELTADRKRRLINRVAELAGRMHSHGVNHRDMYICHFVVKTATIDEAKPQVFVIDLHRAQCRRAQAPHRWVVKDLAGLFFSALHVGLTRRDVLRFLRCYFGKPLRKVLRAEAALLDDVTRRAEKQFAKYWKKPPPSLL